MVDAGVRPLGGADAAAVERDAQQLRVGDVELVDDAVTEHHVGDRRAAQVHEPELHADELDAVQSGVVQLRRADPTAGDPDLAPRAARRPQDRGVERVDDRVTDPEPTEVRVVAPERVDDALLDLQVGQPLAGQVEDVDALALDAVPRQDVTGSWRPVLEVRRFGQGDARGVGAGGACHAQSGGGRRLPGHDRGR